MFRGGGAHQQRQQHRCWERPSYPRPLPHRRYFPPNASALVGLAGGTDKRRAAPAITTRSSASVPIARRSSAIARLEGEVVVPRNHGEHACLGAVGEVRVLAWTVDVVEVGWAVAENPV